MKVMHCCLAAFYIDNYGYQENILPKMHALQGHDVEILASTETYLDNRKLGYVTPSTYLNEDNITVTRIPYVSWLPHKVARKVRLYKNLQAKLDQFRPDILFFHDLQFLSVIHVIRYLKSNPGVRVFADGHTDHINSARSILSRYLLHGLFYKICVKTIEPYVEVFWGVTPLRKEFFSQVYGVAEDKTDLLVLGVDDSVVNLNQREDIRRTVRKDLKIHEESFVLITGGKLDKRKQIHNFLRALRSEELSSVTLLLFGVPSDEMRDQISELSKRANVIDLGWLEPKDVYQYLFAADLAVFPGTHSILWEQSVGVGLPCIFRRWRGMEHVDVGGNCIFIEDGEVGTIETAILEVINDPNRYQRLLSVARGDAVAQFSYSNIAKRAIDLE